MFDSTHCLTWFWYVTQRVGVQGNILGSSIVPVTYTTTSTHGSMHRRHL
jgi:hypothetical protein